ncbi:MAG TPA: hypothetical protein VMZ49_03485 [Patescibacteria group bacterium]|nr:hypothetical protein [Patescibacteria group bacterium]
MKSLWMIIALGFLCMWQKLPAQEQQPDMEAMMRWGSADVIHYHIVGVYQAQTNVIGGANAIGYADVTDRVTIDLKWKLSESQLVGQPVFLNEKSAFSNLRDYEPKCLPPKLKGEYEHFELLGIKDGLGGALELQVQTNYPAAEVVQFCTGKFKPVPARVKTEPVELVVPSPVMFGMPLPDSDNLRISKDKKSMIHKKDGWTWTFTPTLESNK